MHLQIHKSDPQLGVCGTLVHENESLLESTARLVQTSSVYLSDNAENSDNCSNSKVSFY